MTVTPTFPETKKTCFKADSKEIRRSSFKKIIKFTGRFFRSIFIPVSISFIISLFATFVFKMNDGENFFYNALEVLGKIVIPCLPLQTWYILRQ